MLELLIGILLIVLVTYGGGPVFIPMFEDLLVDKLAIFSIEDFTTVIAIVNSFPGPVGGKLSSYSGYVVDNWLGFILASIAFLLPGIIMMIIAYNFIEKIKESQVMKRFIIYIKPIIIGIFLTIIVKFLNLSIQSMGILEGLMIFIMAFYLLEYKKIQPIILIVLSLLYGVILAIPLF